MKEIFVTTFNSESQGKRADVVRVDRDARTYEQLQQDGTWRSVSLYKQDDGHEGFRLSETVGRSGAVNRTAHVHVRLGDEDRTLEWRQIEAGSLYDALKIAESQSDVEVALEASWTPGGVAT